MSKEDVKSQLAPDLQVLTDYFVEEAPATPVETAWGRKQDDWVPVLEDAPRDGKTYGRLDGEWSDVTAASALPHVTEIVPAIGNVGMVGSITGHVYGEGFTATTKVFWDGVEYPTNYISANELTIDIAPSLGVAQTVATITVQDLGVAGTGAAGFHFIRAPGLFITELHPDKATIGPTAADVIVHAYGAAFTATTEILVDGAPVATTLVSPSEVTYVAQPSVELAARVAVVTVRDGAVIGSGADAFEFTTVALDVLDLTLINPNYISIKAPDTIVEAHGKMFTATTVVQMNGTAVPTTFVSSTELTFVVAPFQLAAPAIYNVTVVDGATTGASGAPLTFVDLATNVYAGAIIEPPPDDKGYVRRRDLAGVSQWVPPADTATLYKGRYQPTTNTPDIVTLVKEDQWMWLADIVDPSIPETPLVALPGITVPIKEGDHIVWDATTSTFLLISGWASYHFDTGLSFDDATREVDLQPAADSPAGLGGVYVVERTRTAFQGLELNGDGELKAPLATDLLAGSIVEPPPDDKGYVRRRDLAGVSAWVPPADTPLPDFGTGLSFDDTTLPGIVHLQPAADTPAGLGGIYIVDRTRTEIQGLELNGDGELKAPLATDLLAGSIIEPPPDDKGYVRRRTLAGESAWVPPADTPIPDFGTGLSLDDTVDPQIVHLQPAADTPAGLGGIYVVDRTRTAIQGLELNGDGELKAPLASDLLAGTHTEPLPNGIAHTRQYDVATSKWIWTPALTAGLTITGILPDKAIFGPAEPLLTVHAYGTDFTATCVIMVDGVDTVTTFVSATELTFVMNPAVPISEQSHIITVKDTAPVPPATGVGAGAEGFDFIVASTQVDYGTGLSFDTAATPPIVHLQPAGPAANLLGGVWVPPRTATQGLELYPGADPLLLGQVIAPVATDLLAGSIVEPPPDDKKYSRTRTAAGVSSWVEGADVDIAGNAPPEVGVIYVTARNKTNQGLNLNADGGLYAPPATHEHLGSIVEPLNDGKTYARKTEAGNSSWVETLPTKIAGNNAADVGVIFVPDDRGLNLGADGSLTLRPAGEYPLLGGIFEPPILPADKTYVRKTGQWVEALQSAGVLVSDTPPVPTPPATNHPQGTMWWESDTGDLYVWYIDVDTGQWVQVNGESAPPTITVSDDPPQTPTENQLWWDSNKGTLNLWYTDVDTTQWVEVAAPQKPGVPEAPIDGVPYARRDANWVATTSLAATPGDVKSGFQVNDHGGWIILNGRLVNTLTSTQQAQAALLGFTANLPNATGTVPLQNGSALGLVAGNMAKTIAQANLPALTLTSSGHDAAAVTTSSHDAAAATTSAALNFSDEVGIGPRTGQIAAGGTGQWYVRGDTTNVRNYNHTHTVDLPAHTHTVDLPNHTHTVALGGSGTPLDTTPKSMSVNYFVFLGA